MLSWSVVSRSLLTCSPWCSLYYYFWFSLIKCVKSDTQMMNLIHMLMSCLQNTSNSPIFFNGEGMIASTSSRWCTYCCSNSTNTLEKQTFRYILAWHITARKFVNCRVHCLMCGTWPCGVEGSFLINEQVKCYIPQGVVQNPQLWVMLN